MNNFDMFSFFSNKNADVMNMFQKNNMMNNFQDQMGNFQDQMSNFQKSCVNEKQEQYVKNMTNSTAETIGEATDHAKSMYNLYQNELCTNYMTQAGTMFNDMMSSNPQDSKDTIHSNTKAFGDMINGAIKSSSKMADMSLRYYTKTAKKLSDQCVETMHNTCCFDNKKETAA